MVSFSFKLADDNKHKDDLDKDYIAFKDYNIELKKFNKIESNPKINDYKLYCL